MGMYTYITEEDRVNMRLIKDFDIKEVFEEALKHDPSLMMTGNIYPYKKAWYKKTIEVKTYSVYHECFLNGKPTFEARAQLSASGSKEIVLAYLYGIINGSLSRLKQDDRI